MQEKTWDNDDVLVNHPTTDQINEAIANPNNKYIAFHKPGSIVTTKSGAVYEIQSDGSWRKVKPKF